ncbi:MAG: 2-C-methyl-D-erythritol 4-phosphate cytidylyltransferase [Dissulfuribacterales bacterium]
MRVSGIVAAAGMGVRFGSVVPKQFLPLNGRPVLYHSVNAMLLADFIQEVVVAVHTDYMEQATLAMQDLMSVKPVRLVEGGASRQESVKNALLATDPALNWVAVHDGARPLVTPDVIEELCILAKDLGAALLAAPVMDTVKETDEDGLILRTIPRDRLFLAQTPQVCKKADLLRAYEEADKKGLSFTDEAGLLELIGVPVAVMSSDWTNLKITEPVDLQLAELILQARNSEKTKDTTKFPSTAQVRAHLSFPAHKAASPCEMPRIRVGMGYDAHRLTAGRRLVLGGVEIPFDFGLDGHSDADVLTHALCDAILGAMGEGDIGCHFPDSDMRYKDISSLLLLKEVVKLAHARGFSVENADITLVAQAPKLAPYFQEMRGNIAEICAAPAACINIKATTTEGMGFAGKGEGMACYATVLVAKQVS